MKRTWYLHECSGRVFVDLNEQLDDLFSDCATRVLCVEQCGDDGVWRLVAPDSENP